ncbi:MAG: helix-turn-helix domain-containing protein [Myxococcota bacterium]
MAQRPQLKRFLPDHRSISVHHRVQGEATPMRATVVHDHACLAFYLAGCARVWQGSHYTLRAGDVFIVPHGAPHRMVAAEGVEFWGLSLCTSCYAVASNGELVRVFDEVSAGGCAVRSIAAARRPQLAAWLERLTVELSEPREYSELAVSGLLALLMAEVLRAEPVRGVERGDKTPPLITATLRYIERNALEPISLQDVAMAMGRSTAYLTTVVKEHTGWTVMDWLTRVRMNEARRLLLHTDELVEIIAERVGYSSPSHFHRLFRRAHDVTPAAWRRAHCDSPERDDPMGD